MNPILMCSDDVSQFVKGTSARHFWWVRALGRRWATFFQFSYTGTNIYLYPWQINGIIYMLLMTYGYISMQSKELGEHRAKSEVIQAVTVLMGLVFPPFF